MFYLSVGDNVRLSHWPKNRAIQVIAIGVDTFIAKDLKDDHPVGDEQLYQLTEAWELLPKEVKFPVTTSLVLGEYGRIGTGSFKDNRIKITLDDSALAISFAALLNEDSVVGLSIEFTPAHPKS